LTGSDDDGDTWDADPFLVAVWMPDEQDDYQDQTKRPP
jgi:hypothetical protein